MPEVKTHEASLVPLHISMCTNWIKSLPSNSQSSSSNSSWVWKKKAKALLQNPDAGYCPAHRSNGGWCGNECDCSKNGSVFCSSHSRFPTDEKGEFTPRAFEWLFFFPNYAVPRCMLGVQLSAYLNSSWWAHPALSCLVWKSDKISSVTEQTENVLEDISQERVTLLEIRKLGHKSIWAFLKIVSYQNSCINVEQNKNSSARVSVGSSGVKIFK